MDVDWSSDEEWSDIIDETDQVRQNPNTGVCTVSKVHQNNNFKCPETQTNAVDHAEPLTNDVDNAKKQTNDEPPTDHFDYVEQQTNDGDHTEPQTDDVNYAEQQINDVDHTEPQTNDVDHTELQINDVDHAEPQTNDVDHTEPQTSDVDHTEPQTHDADHTEPQTIDADHTEPQTDDVNYVEQQTNDVDHTEPQTNDVDHAEPQTNEVDHTEQQTSDADQTEPQTNVVDHAEPKTNDINNTETPTNDVSQGESQTNNVSHYRSPTNDVTPNQCIAVIQKRISRLRKKTLRNDDNTDTNETETESSDDDIPLSYIKKNKDGDPLSVLRKKNTDISDDNDIESTIDSEESYKLTKDDIHSSDSNLSSFDQTDADDPIFTEISKQAKKKRLKKFKESRTREIKRQGKYVHISKISRNVTAPSNIQTINQQCVDYTEDGILQAVKMTSVQDAYLIGNQKTLYENRLDNVLTANGMIRKEVLADGDCFFRAAVLYFPSVGNEINLRQILCKHIIDHANEYVLFFSTSDANESYEEDILWIDFRTEVEELKCHGRWTNRAADILPLALANWSRRKIIIFTSLPEKPIIEVAPTIVGVPNLSETIFLAYLTGEGNTFPSHYDGCIKMGTLPHHSDKIETETIFGDEAVIDDEDERHENATETNITPEKIRKKNGRPKGTPPRKAPTFMTPPKKRLFRKRKSLPDEWKKNVRKMLRMTGKEYVSQRGKVVPKRVVKPIDCSKCKYNCNEKITEEDREKIFNTFWSLESYERKKDFVISRVQEKQTRKYIAPNDSEKKRKREIYRSFSFECDDKKVLVCKNFFKSTLDVGDAYIDNAMINESGGVYSGTDKRGKHCPHNKTKDADLDRVRQHIESFPVVEGHYTRKESNRKYLGAELNITKMYHLYKEHYKQQPNIKPVSLAIYRKVFNEEYNFSFHVPKKDQCNICVNYNRGLEDNTITDEEKKKYEEHQQQKIRAREEKKKDKDAAQLSKDIFVATFDLQAVLQTPCSLVSQIFYMRKLNCYNLSIYNLGSQDATCYLWSEADAKRGACEIATCLYLQLLSLQSTFKHAILYSDACAGQNRNQFTATALMHAAINLPNLEIIDHKFLESGHTQMECDSMHSAIEFAKKKMEINIPREWANCFKMARKKKPYLVIPMQYGDVYDFKQLTKSTLKYNKVDTEGEKINWLKIKWLRYTKNDTGCIQFKMSYDDEFRKMKVVEFDKKGVALKTLRGKPLPKKYKGPQPISVAKKKDLINLCKTKVIPSDYHEFYRNLQSNSNVVDTLPCPDVQEEDQDSDKDQ